MFELDYVTASSICVIVACTMYLLGYMIGQDSVATRRKE